MTVTTQIDLPLDLQTMDETGLPWTFLDEARDPSLIFPGAHVVAGSGAARAVVVVVDITPEGIVHVCDVPGSIASNAQLLDTHRVVERLPDFLADPGEPGGRGRDETAQPTGETPKTLG